MIDDHPIEPQDFVSGVKVVDIGDIRVSRGLSRHRYESCQHKNTVYDEKERRIYCQDCEKGIHPFDAFVKIVKWHAQAVAKINSERKQVEESLEFSIRSRAAKNIDIEWRAKNTCPACPSCSEALLPEDFADGVKMTVGKEFARRKRGLK